MVNCCSAWCSPRRQISQSVSSLDTIINHWCFLLCRAVSESMSVLFPNHATKSAGHLGSYPGSDDQLAHQRNPLNSAYRLQNNNDLNPALLYMAYSPTTAVPSTSDYGTSTQNVQLALIALRWPVAVWFCRWVCDGTKARWQQPYRRSKQKRDYGVESHGRGSHHDAGGQSAAAFVLASASGHCQSGDDGACLTYYSERMCSDDGRRTKRLAR